MGLHQCRLRLEDFGDSSSTEYGSELFSESVQIQFYLNLDWFRIIWSCKQFLGPASNWDYFRALQGIKCNRIKKRINPIGYLSSNGTAEKENVCIFSSKFRWRKSKVLRQNREINSFSQMVKKIALRLDFFPKKHRTEHLTRWWHTENISFR